MAAVNAVGLEAVAAASAAEPREDDGAATMLVEMLEVLLGGFSRRLKMSSAMENAPWLGAPMPMRFLDGPTPCGILRKNCES